MNTAIVEPVKILVRAVLLQDKDRHPRLQDGIELFE